MVSMKEIAKKLNISRCTVSNILNNKLDTHKYKEETIKLVRDTAKEMGYVSNIIAKSLKTGRTGTIAIVVPDIANTFYINIIKSLEKKSYLSGYNLIICAAEEQVEKEDNILLMLQSRMIDGVLISPVSYTRSIKGNYSYPIVCFDRKVKNDKYPSIIINNKEITQQAIELIIKKGAREILFLAGDPEDFSVVERLKGYKNALAKNNLDFDSRRVIYEIYDEKVAYEKMCKLVKDNDISFDSIFISTNYFIYGVIKALYENEVAIENIIGFEKFMEADFAFKNIPKVIQPENEIAERAFNRLISEIKGEKSENRIEIVPAFIECNNGYI
ncbi:LacI family DNA-binding transcriptional regulator [Petroclostridium sp. X23]|uniref:LacI family DNA-binding transcriptional regulator n=1 Tax=Petroclostridium sp. X23 TaxID=3045146 RepID=UPI0024ACCBCF|nr:LacI family DNA-binding transcriptional regulator [Petroclostridium sp. X23]WHH56820.1 LacI family DNA-binding transcriptional regulator [Petroclostridium sp. X23]